MIKVTFESQPKTSFMRWSVTNFHFIQSTATSVHFHFCFVSMEIKELVFNVVNQVLFTIYGESMNSRVTLM